MTKEIASVRLIDRKTRVVELLGPKPPGSRRPTDIELKFLPAHQLDSWSVGVCFKAEDRRARFIVNKGRSGDDFLDYLERSRTATRLAAPYGVNGYLVEEGGSTGNRQSTPSKGEIYHSGHSGQILSVAGKPVRR